MIREKKKSVIPMETKKHTPMWTLGAIFFTPKPNQNEMSKNALKIAISTWFKATFSSSRCCSDQEEIRFRRASQRVRRSESSGVVVSRS